MQKSTESFDQINARAERIGVIGSPSETSGIKVDILGQSVDRRLVGALTYFICNQDGKRLCALGQITEIMLRNPWVEDATMRSLIRQKGRVDPITGRQDTHTADMTVGAVFAESKGKFEQSELGTIPATGTEIKLVDNSLLDHLLSGHEDVIHRIGRIYGTNTYFPSWFRHFGPGKGGANEAYHLGIFGKTGSGKSVLAEILLMGYASHPQMSLFVIDPQGQFYKDFKEGTPGHDFIKKKLNKNVIALNAKDIWLTDHEKYPFFLEILAKTGFFKDLVIIHEENQQRAKNEIVSILNPPKEAQQRLVDTEVPKPWDLHKREVFNRVWAGLGQDKIQARIYTTTNLIERLAAKYASLSPDEMYVKWSKAAKLFTKEGRSGAKKLTELTDLVLDEKKGCFVVIDLSEEGAPMDVLWNEEVKLVVIRRIIQDLREKAEKAYRNEKKLNTLVLLDEAHRFAPRDISEDKIELQALKNTLVDSVRTTRKYGLGWAFISQTLNSLDRELIMQLRIYIFGYGLAWGSEYRALNELIGGSEALKLYQSFRDPESSIGERQYPFMAIGPISPLSFSGTPLFFTALKWPEEVLELFAKSVGDGKRG